MDRDEEVRHLRVSSALTEHSWPQVREAAVQVTVGLSVARSLSEEVHF